MKTTATALLALGLLAPALAQDVDRDDIPRQCESVCSNIVTVSDECDRQFNRDRDELDCVCRADNAQEIVPLCAACVDFYDTDDDDDNDIEDNDVGDLRRDCGFATTSYDPSSTYTMPQMIAATNLGSSGSSGNTSPTPTNNQASVSSALDSISSSLATATTTDEAALSSVVNSVSSDLSSQATTAADAASSDNAAANRDGSAAALAGAALLAAAAYL